MKNLVLVPGDTYGMGIIQRKEVICTSRAVAETFGKRHDNVLSAIRTCGASDKFTALNFKESSYRDLSGKRSPEILMTRDGFSFIVMGFTGRKAARFKEAYINRFNEMEADLQAQRQARMECRQLTDAIKSVHEPAKPYHFSNEMNMILQVVTGKTAKQLKAARNLPGAAQVRDYLSPSEMRLVQALQPVAAYLNVTNHGYQERKRLLREYAERNRTLLGGPNPAA